MISDLNINNNANMLEVTYLGEIKKFHNYWLRDNCLCSICFLTESRQRKINILTIPLDIKIKSCKLVKNEIEVVWSDNHVSKYDIEYLLKLKFDNFKKILKNDFNKRVLWDRDIIEKENYVQVEFEEYMKDDTVAKIVCENLIKYGFAFIKNVPVSMKGTEIAVTRLFPIKKTLFGELEIFQGKNEHTDVAYTTDYLDRHSDNVYFNDPAGLVINQCLEHDGTGAFTFFIDAFKAVTNFKIKNPDAFDRLCKVQLTSHFTEPGQHHSFFTPIIQTNPITGDLENIRYNINDRTTMNTLPDDKIMQFYEDYHQLLKELYNEKNEFKFKLTPGTVLLMDNWRLLHGRTEYTGNRTLCAGYVARTDYLSKVRVMGVIS